MTINRIPFNALVDDDGSNLIGSIWNKTAIKDVLLDPIDADLATHGNWVSYAPSWLGTGGTSPTLGNGILVGKFVLIGKLCHVSISLKLGTTSTPGTSTFYRFSLPQVMAIGTGFPQECAMVGIAKNPAGAIYGGWTAAGDSSSTLYAVNYAGALWNPTTPFTWATDAVFSVRGTFEVA